MPQKEWVKLSRTLETDQRFSLSVEYDESTGCLLWKATVNNKGYGMFYHSGGRELAHRFSYRMAKGPIPHGWEIDHLCRNTFCVNPLHLEPVSHRENIRRGLTAQRNRERAQAQTHCKRGHPLSGENLLRSKTQRACRACNKEKRHRHYISAAELQKIDSDKQAAAVQIERVVGR